MYAVSGKLVTSVSGTDVPDSLIGNAVEPRTAVPVHGAIGHRGHPFVRSTSISRVATLTLDLRSVASV
jgi:hypothetical protein